VSKIAEPSTINGTVDSMTISVDLLRDAGAGKVRGLNGRYVNKSKPSPAAKKGPNIKYVKKCKPLSTFSINMLALLHRYANNVKRGLELLWRARAMKRRIRATEALKNPRLLTVCVPSIRELGQC
jgi:hypothetical protein